MRVNHIDFDSIAGCRYGFLIADMVLGDTLSDFAEGSADEAEVEMALEQHRHAYEGYVKRLHASIEPVAEA